MANKKLVRDTSTPEGKRIWDVVEKAAALAPKLANDAKCGCCNRIKRTRIKEYVSPRFEEINGELELIGGQLQEDRLETVLDASACQFPALQQRLDEAVRKLCEFRDQAAVSESTVPVQGNYWYFHDGMKLAYENALRALGVKEEPNPVSDGHDKCCRGIETIGLGNIEK